jgi:membrane protease YdiL (CAAX protease family)
VNLAHPAEHATIAHNIIAQVAVNPLSSVSLQSESETFSIPWTGWDVLLFLTLLFVAQGVSAKIAYTVSPSQPPEQATMTTPTETEDHGHLIIQLVKQGKDSPIVLFIAFFVTVAAAPLVEEFLFRLLLQGWFEAKFTQFRVPCAGGVAIVTVSFFFATIHAGNSSASNGQTLFYFFSALTVANLLIVALGITYLVKIRDVKITHCLFGTERFFRPHFFANVGWCLLALMFIFGISFIMDVFCPGINTDPIPIFFFSLLLGTLYYKTRNLSYCILLHACLNLISLILLCLGEG